MKTVGKIVTEINLFLRNETASSLAVICALKISTTKERVCFYSHRFKFVGWMSLFRRFLEMC